MTPAADIPNEQTAVAAASIVRVLSSARDALVVLARKGAWIEPVARRDHGRLGHGLWLEGATAPHAALTPEAFADLMQDGAIAAIGDHTRWGLSAKGRLAVRRLMSRRGEPAAAAANAPAPTPPPAPLSAASVNPCESPLGWLRRRTDKDGRPLIDDAQFQAGERLRADIYFAGLGPRVTTSWSAAAIPGGRTGGACGGGVEQSDRALAARERVNRALAAVGPELSGILIDVCGHLKGLEDIEDARGWAKRSAKVVLDLSLTALARHYGYITVAAPATAAPAKVRHWGSDDYRPGMEAWME